jgi:hypothetical protein
LETVEKTTFHEDAAWQSFSGYKKKYSMERIERVHFWIHAGSGITMIDISVLQFRERHSIFNETHLL